MAKLWVELKASWNHSSFKTESGSLGSLATQCLYHNVSPEDPEFLKLTPRAHVAGEGQPHKEASSENKPYAAGALPQNMVRIWPTWSQDPLSLGSQIQGLFLPAQVALPLLLVVLYPPMEHMLFWLGIIRSSNSPVTNITISPLEPVANQQKQQCWKYWPSPSPFFIKILQFWKISTSSIYGPPCWAQRFTHTDAVAGSKPYFR